MAKGWWGVLLAAFFALSETARAQDAAPEPSPGPGSQGDVTPAMARDLARLEALLPAFAAQARAERQTAGAVFLATGLVALPVGIVADASWHQDYGVGLWVGGALFLGFGVLDFVWQTPLETLDFDFQASAATLTPAQRLAFGAGGLASVADGARRGRVVGAIIDFILAGLFYGVAVGELVSASNTSGSDATNLQSGATASLVLGGCLTGAGVVQLVLPSPAETAYAVFASGAGPGPGGFRLSGGLAPVHGGAMVGLGGAF